MNQKPLSEIQILNRFVYFAANKVSADSGPVGNACFLLSRGTDDNDVIARWPEILTEFAVLFRSTFPAGLHIPSPSSRGPREMRHFQPALAEALRVWEEAKRKVLGLPAYNLNTPHAPSTPGSPSRLLTGGSAGEPLVTDDETVGADQQAASRSPAQVRSHPRSQTLFQEVTVRPAKVTRQDSVAPALIDATALASAEREAADADAFMAAMLGTAPAQTTSDDTTSTQLQTLPPSVAATLLNSLATGLTPPEFAPMLHVGRKSELLRLNTGLQQLNNGDSFLNFVTAPNGAGKTHLFNVAQQAALNQKSVVSRVEFRPEYRLHGNDKDSRALIAAVILGLQVKGCAAGEGLETVLAALKTRITDGHIMTPDELTSTVWKHCGALSRHRLGDALVEVIASYFVAVEAQDAKRQARLLRWLRAGYDTRAAAQKETGINAVIDGDSFLDYLRLLALLCRVAGFGGLLVIVDEMILLTRNAHGRDRDQNFDALLGIINATAQGHAPGLGFIFGGTPDFLEHRSRGLFSHDALRTRLEEVGGINGSSAGPILRLRHLTPEELFLLLRRTRTLLCSPAFTETRLPDDALHAILGENFKRSGAAETVTPREVLRKLAHVISALNQSPTSKWQDVLQRNSPTTDNRNNTTPSHL